MDAVVVDEWSVVAYAGRGVDEQTADEIRRAVAAELAAAVARLSDSLDPAVTVRVER